MSFGWTKKMTSHQSQNPSTKHILVTLSGNTPQIVTETLFALRIKEGIPITAIYLITTKKGKENALKALAGEDGGSRPPLLDNPVRSQTPTHRDNSQRGVE